MLISALVIWYISQRDKPVYLIDFAVFEPPEDWKLNHDQLMDIMGKQGCFTEDSLNFLSRMLMQSGVGPATAWPPGITKCLTGAYLVCLFIARCTYTLCTSTRAMTNNTIKK
jgi:3-ketoacyl-CoA synthase